MSKFKKGDWIREDDAEPGDTMRGHGYCVHDVLPNGDYVIEVNEDVYSVWSKARTRGCIVEPSCTGWDWVLPLINGTGMYLTRNNRIVVITERRSEKELSRQDSCPDHIWRGYTTVYNSYNTYRSDGTWDAQENRPSAYDIVAKYVEPPKPATKTIVLEEWCCLQRGTATFDWQEVGNRACVSVNWFKTGVTRELEVPDAK